MKNNRSHTEDALHHAYGELEKRVEQRTAELVKANNSLRVEIAERKQIEEALRRSQAQLLALFSAMKDVVIVYDFEGRYVEIAPTNTPYLYKPGVEMLGKKLGEVLPATQAGILMSVICMALETQNTVSVDYELSIEGKQVWFEGVLSPVQNNLVILVAHDITERKETEQQLMHRAMHDGLTGLLNRASFFDLLTRTMARARRHTDYLAAVLFLDLDRFKIVNDTFGHYIGDQVLIQAARRLEACLRPGDVVARFGGDEFAILIDDIRHPRDAIQVADRVLKKLAVPYTFESSEISLSCSIGIALNSPEYQRAEDFMANADRALYQAKSNGKGRHEIHQPGGV